MNGEKLSVSPERVSAVEGFELTVPRVRDFGYASTKRLFDIIVAIMASIILFLPMLVIALVIKLTSPGPVLHWSKRVGRHNRLFLMPKFRSMRIDTPQLATHLLTDPDTYLTRVGRLVRKTSLDELPQLYSILRGDLSFVGPRPALFNQDDLVELRTKHGVHALMPGLTGWAQVNGRDDLAIRDKVQLEREYMARMSLMFDVKILVMTLLKVVSAADVSH